MKTGRVLTIMFSKTSKIEILANDAVFLVGSVLCAANTIVW